MSLLTLASLAWVNENQPATNSGRIRRWRFFLLLGAGWHYFLKLSFRTGFVFLKLFLEIGCGNSDTQNNGLRALHSRCLGLLNLMALLALVSVGRAL